MDARALVSDRGLTALAVRHLTDHALGDIALESLAPTKALLKRWFSSAPWTAADDDALAAAVGPGEGWWSHRLDDELVLSFGWVEGRFALQVELTAGHLATHEDPEEPDSPAVGPVTPEATPNPRSVMFRTGPVHEGPSQPHRAGEPTDDPRVAGLFKRFPDVTDVMVSADFVAVSLRRADRWEALLAPMAEAVAEQFLGEDDHGQEQAVGGPGRSGPGPGGNQALRQHRESRLERAWRELGSLRPDREEDLPRILAAASHQEAAHRQVAANLLREADPGVALVHWGRLAHDQSRLVRRATVDAMVDVGRQELRPLLESALGDHDGWVRWKALRGLAELGAGPSHEAVAALTDDPDFRVRREARVTLGADS